MKDLLDQARAATTAHDLANAIATIETARDELRNTHHELVRRHQEAVVSGRGEDKAKAAVIQANNDLMQAEAAVAGFSARKAELEKAEAAAGVAELQRRRNEAAAEHEKACIAYAEKMVVARAASLDVHSTWDRLERLNDQLAAVGEPTRLMTRPQAIAARVFGEPAPVARGVSEFARRADTVFRDMLSSTEVRIRHRARTGVEEGGRFGETRGARSAILAGVATLQRKA